MKRLKIAVVGSGISGLGAAWLLAKSHDVSLFEAENHWGGHSFTFDAPQRAAKPVPVDCGFIVYNNQTYPNLSALFDYLDVPTAKSNMGFSVSIRDGAYEYSGAGLFSLMGSTRNLTSQSHWRMMHGLVKFFRLASSDFSHIDESISLGEFATQHGLSKEFVDLHLLPVAGAIWSSAPHAMLAYPAKAFLKFFKNHGLLNYIDRPQWRTVQGGARNYVSRLIADSQLSKHVNQAVTSISRTTAGIDLKTSAGQSLTFDHVVLATHADVALSLMARPLAIEHELLSPFTYSENQIVLHQDEKLMPKRRRHWSSWNYVAGQDASAGGITYWMNALQPLESSEQFFVSVNPASQPAAAKTKFETTFRHPIFTGNTAQAQKNLWDLQGKDRVWFCGAYFGSGFHEDGLQSGLALAEELGGKQRPWALANANDRLQFSNAREALPRILEAAE
ncbi:MAG: FAD-dependent oxidoreductase [Aestuariivirga sp.]